MASLILVVLLAGAVLYLAGGLVYLYRYAQARRSRPTQPRLWEELRRRFAWLSVVGVLLLAGFVLVAWWSLPGHEVPGIPNPFVSTSGPARPGSSPQGVSQLPAQSMVSGMVPTATEATSSTTGTTATTATLATETTSTVETTTSASTSSTSSTTETTTTAAQSSPRPAPAAGSWTVCAASFRKAAMARDYAGRLVKEGLPARVNQVDLGQRGVWHRVCVGEFPNLEKARRQYKNWEKQGLISDAFLLPLR